ncbi:MAG: Nif3-like dinuclear metal center hexameric protein [Acutalibacteraceae bacterium]|nr:Nif3-like dinuclear metal center hexameric protein [Acutalibacteraceae bacterium]
MKYKLTVKDIFDYINSVAPFKNQCEWDNSGLVVGSFDAEVKKIGVVLDITSDAVKYAAENGIDLIISHHPVIFRPVKTFLADDIPFMLAKSGISAICAHTSLDIAKGGVNDALAEALGFENATPLAESGEESMVRVVETAGTTADELAKLVAEKLSTCVTVADGGKTIRKIALCGGAGADFFEKSGCDAYITGEVKHHEYLQAKECGITLIAAGHFETENPVVTVIADKIKDNFDCDVEIIPQNSPVKYYK